MSAQNSNRIMELAEAYAEATDDRRMEDQFGTYGQFLIADRHTKEARAELATEVQAQQDYTRAVIAERDALRKAAQMALECLDSLSNGDYLDMASEVTEVGWVDIDASAKSLRKELGHV